MTSSNGASTRAWLADLALLAVAAVWGATFVMVKEALVEIRPFAFLFVRFSLAFVLLVPLAVRGARATRPGLWRSGIICGTWLFAGYAAQTTGLQQVPAGRTAFITGLSVIFVPLLSGLLGGQAVGWRSLAGVAAATVGLALLTLGGDLATSPGDLLVLLCAVCFAMHIVSVAAAGAANAAEAGLLTVLQIGVTAVLAGALSVLTEGGYWAAVTAASGAPLLRGPVVAAIAVTAIMATALGFLVQNLAQRHTSPTHTALIFSSEPAFGAFFAWLLAGEQLGPRALGGAALILAGILLAASGPAATPQASTLGDR